MPPAPQPIGDILAQLMARRGFARVQTATACEDAWREVAGSLGRYAQVGAVRGGTLTVMVANSAVLQELVFRKRELLASLNKLLPDERIKEVRFRVGPVSR